MTTKADFSDEEWKQILEGPTSAGMVVAVSEKGGTFRETFAMAGAYTDARKEHGASELLDEIITHRPKTERFKAHSKEELKDKYLEEIRTAIGFVEAKATAQELGDYRLFVVNLAKKVAAAKEEKGSDDGVTEAEAAAIAEIESVLGVTA